MISFFRKFIQKRVDAAVAIISQSLHGRHAEYIKTLELDNEKLRDMVASLTVDNVDSYHTYMHQLRKQIRKSKIGDTMDCHIRLMNGLWEIYHIETIICAGYDSLKEYQVQVRASAGNPKKDRYVFTGHNEYWKQLGTKEMLHSHSMNELFRGFKDNFEELSNEGFFPSSGHRR